MIHHILKGSWSIGLAKWHHHELIKTVWAPKGGFPFIPFFHMDQMVFILEVDFREDWGASEMVLHLTHDW
jgi:hypothetical protein